MELKNATLGIKLADGTFFPITDESYRGKKRLVLTSAQQDQKSVKVDLLRHTGDVDSAMRLGTLAVIIPEGETRDVEFFIEIDEQNRLNASAGLVGQNDPQTLSVNLSDYSGDMLTEDSESEGEEDLPRSDQEILADESLATSGDLDSFDDFDLGSPGETNKTLDPDALSLDDDISPQNQVSDQEILGNDELALDGLDDLSTLDFPLDAPEDDSLSKAAGLGAEVLNTDEISLDNEEAPQKMQEGDFDLSGLDEDLGTFDLDETTSVSEELETPNIQAETIDEVDSLGDLGDFGAEDLSLDAPVELDNEPLEPTTKAPSQEKSEFNTDEVDSLGDLGDFGAEDFSLDAPMELDNEPLEPTNKGTLPEKSQFNTDEMDSLGDLEGFDGLDLPQSGDLNDQDFSLESLDLDTPAPAAESNDEEDFEIPMATAPKAVEKPVQPVKKDEPRTESRSPEKKKKPKPVLRQTEETPLDKAALVFSLVTLSLLVTTILALLFFNMLKAPTPAPVPKQVSTSVLDHLPYEKPEQEV